MPPMMRFASFTLDGVYKMTALDIIKNVLNVNRDDVIDQALELGYYSAKSSASKANKAKKVIGDLIDCICDSLDQGDFNSVSMSYVYAMAVIWLDENRPVTIGGQITSRDSQLENMPAGRYIITAAQNNTGVHPAFFENLLLCAKTIGAQIQILPIRYTTQLDQLSKATPVWVPEVREYLLDDDAFINSSVRLATSANILPTAKIPVNAAAALNDGEYLTLVAHTKRQIKTLPRPKDGGIHRWAATTGVCTLRHYTDSRAGAEASARHTYGALVVDVEHSGQVRFDEITANENGDFVYKQRLYRAGHASRVIGSQAMVLGDLHCEKMCVDSWQRAIEQVKFFKPEVVAIHDCYDQMSRNHHNLKSGKFLYSMQNRAVIDDLTDVISRINELAAYCGNVYIVQSNHDLALDKWLDDGSYRPDQDPINAKLYYFLKFCILESIDNGEDIQALELAFRELREIAPQLPKLAVNVIFGNQNKSFKVAGVELSQHGHTGNNGARGSANAYKSWSMPIVTGHTHAPYKDGDQVTVGVTGSLDMGYNIGGTSWDRANAVIDILGITNLVFPYAIGETQY